VKHRHSQGGGRLIRDLQDGSPKHGLLRSSCSSLQDRSQLRHIQVNAEPSQPVRIVRFGGSDGFLYLPWHLCLPHAPTPPRLRMKSPISPSFVRDPMHNAHQMPSADAPDGESHCYNAFHGMMKIHSGDRNHDLQMTSKSTN
jgi:hypothetical protein